MDKSVLYCCRRQKGRNCFRYVKKIKWKIGKMERERVRVRICAERMKYIYFLKVISKGLFCCIYKNVFFPNFNTNILFSSCPEMQKGWTGVCECVCYKLGLQNSQRGQRVGEVAHLPMLSHSTHPHFNFNWHFTLAAAKKEKMWFKSQEIL